MANNTISLDDYRKLKNTRIKVAQITGTRAKKHLKASEKITLAKTLPTYQRIKRNTYDKKLTELNMNDRIALIAYNATISHINDTNDLTTKLEKGKQTDNYQTFYSYLTHPALSNLTITQRIALACFEIDKKLLTNLR